MPRGWGHNHSRDLAWDPRRHRHRYCYHPNYFSIPRRRLLFLLDIMMTIVRLTVLNIFVSVATSLIFWYLLSKRRAAALRPTAEVREQRLRRFESTSSAPQPRRPRAALFGFAAICTWHDL